MTITVSQISSLVGRFTNSIVNEQAMLECPFVGSGTIKKKKIRDKTGVVNIKAGELRSAGAVADGGTLPEGADVQPVQGTYLPVGIFARISIPRIAAKLASSLDDGIDLVKEEMESCGQTLGRILGRSIFVQTLSGPTANVAAGSTTFTVASASGYRVGMAFEVWRTNTAVEGTTAATLLYVTNIAIPTDGVSDTTITFVGTNGGGSNSAWVAATDTLYLRGTKSNPMVSLGDVTAAASLYGLVHTGNEWSGNLNTAMTTMSVPQLRSGMTVLVRRRGAKPTHIVSNRLNEERYSNLLINNRRFMNGKMDAVGGASFDLEGIPWITDENIDDTDVYYFNDKDVMLHEFQGFLPETNGGKKAGMDMGAALISDTSLIYDVQVLGIYNLRCQRRNGTLRFSGVAA